MAEFNVTVTDFDGLRDDRGSKFIPPNYFHRIENFNFDDIVGANKILSPELAHDFNTTDDIDGIFQFKYVGTNNELVIEEIIVTGGNVYKNALSGVPVLIYSGLTPGKVRFAILNDRLFITNGIDFPLVYNGVAVSEMGAPIATDSGNIGLPSGQYFYAMTYVTAGGEEIIGTVSNTVNFFNAQINLAIPIGYSGTTSRKIYRTVAGGSQLKLLTTISDNTTLTYVDNIADGALGSNIPDVNNECPKPFFIEVSLERLIGVKTTKFPTQAYVTGTEIEVFDAATFVDISNRGNDNSPVVGMAQDYNRILVGTEKNIYLLDVTSTPSVIESRAKVGVKDGYTMVRVPDNSYTNTQGSQVVFPGGIMFVSTENDIRVFSGDLALPVASSLDNIRTDNWAQSIKGSLDIDFKLQQNMYAQFYDYKYHVIVGKTMYVFDLRGFKWTKYRIVTDSYQPEFNVMGVMNDSLYIGQLGDARLEKFYADTQYRGEDILAKLETPDLMADDQMKFYRDIQIYFTLSHLNNIKLTIVLESDYDNTITETLQIEGKQFSRQFYDPQFYNVGGNIEDYRTIHVNRYARWIRLIIESDSKTVFFRGFNIRGDQVINSERGI